ncbi:MAG: tocopherol cyclase family protein [Leptolyngbyaceae cyanobacterium]
MANFFWTPHSGYHWDGTANRFFEGWYIRLTLPKQHESFAFMYSIDDPAGQSPLSGGAAQVLGPGEAYLYSPFATVDRFWAWPHRLGVGHWNNCCGNHRQACYLEASTFAREVDRGYQLTATHHQGCVEDPHTGAIARWNYDIQPVYGWGDMVGPQLSTAGWLSYLSILEPGWQVLMAHGWASGWAEWGDRRYEFQQAPTYIEKNWGGAFPQRWFWLQANAFDEETDLTVTAVGGLRQVLGRSESVGLIGIHLRGQQIVIPSLTATVAWQVETWGSWQVTAYDHRYRLVLQGTAESPPAEVRVPTLTGLEFACWDTARGHLTVEIYKRSPSHSATESQILKATTSLAALEVGGDGWDEPWQFERTLI